MVCDTDRQDSRDSRQQRQSQVGELRVLRGLRGIGGASRPILVNRGKKDTSPTRERGVAARNELPIAFIPRLRVLMLRCRPDQGRVRCRNGENTGVPTGPR